MTTSHTIMTWLWRRPSTGYQLPSVCEYGPSHVNVLYSMLSRHMSEPFNLVCVMTLDDYKEWHRDLDPNITVLVNNNDPVYADLGGCYRRLVQFNYAGLMGAHRWMTIDLDCVVTDDLVPLFKRSEQYDFVINRYCLTNVRRQYYNGALLLMDAGARPQVWQDFLGEPSARGIENDPELVGTDQAWISHVLGPGGVTFSSDDGIYDAGRIGDNLPDDARIVFFHGARDPSVSEASWIAAQYR